jgi:hypothetical protein
MLEESVHDCLDAVDDFGFVGGGFAAAAAAAKDLGLVGWVVFEKTPVESTEMTLDL